MSNEYNASIRKLIARSLEAAKQGRYSYICIQWTDEEGDHAFTFRSDKEKEETKYEDE